MALTPACESRTCKKSMQPSSPVEHRADVIAGWEEVYATDYRRLVALVAAVCGSLSEAEEAVQEAFVRALGVTGHRAVVRDPQAWLYRVAVNSVRARWRRGAVAARLMRLLAAAERAAAERAAAERAAAERA